MYFSPILTLKGPDDPGATEAKHRGNSSPATQGHSDSLSLAGCSPLSTVSWGLGKGERWVRQAFSPVFRQGTWEVKQLGQHEL